MGRGIQKKDLLSLARGMMAHGKEFLKEEENDLKSRSQENKDIEDETPIYRYVSSSVFLSMIEGCTYYNSQCVVGENWLSHISRWEDPFEGFVFRGHSVDIENLNSENSQGVLRNLYQNYFGQSWTLCGKESDLRWRAYCPNGDGVRIKSSIQKLKNDIIQSSKNLVPSACMFSRVYYLSRKSIREKVNLIEKGNSKCGMEMLFIKSNEFSDEKEYRVIIDALLLREALKKCKNGFRVENGFLKYALRRSNDSSTFNLFNDILLDPRMSDMEVERLKSRISQTGLKCAVRQSDVYKW